MRTLSALCATLALAAAAHAQRDAMLVSTGWLAQHLKDPNLVLLHVGDSAEYAGKHIAGGRFLDFHALAEHQDATGLTLQVPAPTDLRQRLAALGISDKSRIVIYWGNDWVSPATRAFLTLDYAGLGSATSILDGGMPAWVRDGHPVTDVVPPAPKTGTLSALKTRPIIVDGDFVRSHIGANGFSIVDGRTASFYDGVQTGGGMGGVKHKTGHIAGAKSVPFTETTDDKLFLKSPAELAALFEKAGVQKGDTVIGYCHIGQQATAMLFAARSLGFPVLLYDGSFEDWSRRADSPVEKR